MISRMIVRKASIGSLIALSVACGAKKEDTTEDEETSAVSTSSSTSSSTTAKVAQASSISDLKLTGALAISLPEAFGGSSSAANLLAAKKSQEACMMGSTIRESVSSLSEVSSFFCHLDVEKDRIKFGKKYKLMTPQGEFARIYVDNSAASSGKITIGFCQADMGDGAHRQLITIDGLTDAGPKGSIVSDGTHTSNGESQSFARSTTFDMSVAGIVNLVSKDKHVQSSNTFVREVTLDLKDVGQSTLQLANKGSFSGSEFFDRGVAYMKDGIGSAIFQSKGSHEGQTFEFARRAHFNKAGEVLASADVSASLQPATTSLPTYLASDFAPDSPTGWVGAGCTDFDEEVTLDPESAGHQACNGNHDDNNSGCWDQNNFESGTEQVTIP